MKMFKLFLTFSSCWEHARGQVFHLLCQKLLCVHFDLEEHEVCAKDAGGNGQTGFVAKRSC